MIAKLLRIVCILLLYLYNSSYNKKTFLWCIIPTIAFFDMIASIPYLWQVVFGSQVLFFKYFNAALASLRFNTDCTKRLNSKTVGVIQSPFRKKSRYELQTPTKGFITNMEKSIVIRLTPIIQKLFRHERWRICLLA